MVFLHGQAALGLRREGFPSRILTIQFTIIIPKM